MSDDKKDIKKTVIIKALKINLFGSIHSCNAQHTVFVVDVHDNIIFKQVNIKYKNQESIHCTFYQRPLITY